uniref:Parvin, alpha a n=1 Tax=Oncorhynchus tshawytscha TaxID=74940 RepID=A0AAZ3RTM2_ONCTS
MICVRLRASSLDCRTYPSSWEPTLSELQEEGMNAINLPLSPTQYELDPEDTVLEENEVRTMVDPNSNNDSKLQELQQVLIDWINDMLVGKRIIVKDLAEDLYDGQVLQKLFENLEGEKLNVAEVTQSEIAQKSIKWNVTVHAKSIVAILHLLVALPDHVSIQVVVDQVLFVNKHLNKLNLEVAELDTQFADSVYLVLLLGLLEGYFVPLYNLLLTDENFDQKVYNVSFSFELMQDEGLERPRPEDIVNCDLKSTLMVLYNLFTCNRHVKLNMWCCWHSFYW